MAVKRDWERTKFGSEQSFEFSVTNIESLSAEEKDQVGICITSVQSLKEEPSSESIPPFLNPDWDQEFEVNWNDLPKHIALQLEVGKRLNPRDKREFVRFISRSITNACPRPKRKNLVTIIQRVVGKYPRSLSDMWSEETAGVGHECLLRKVIYRIENGNRNAYPPTRSLDADGKKRRTPSYKFYGCRNWQPLIYGDEDVLEKKRDYLKHIAEGSKTMDNLSRVMMRETYKLQRRDINQGYDINKLTADWPYLFTIEGLLDHFTELVGIDLRRKLETALFSKGDLIFSSLSKIAHTSERREKLRETLSELLACGDVTSHQLISSVAGLLTLITEYFEERQDSLYITLKNSVTKEEVEDILQLRGISFPFIVVLGSSALSCKKCMLCVDGKVVIEEISSFRDAFLGLFCLFYCLNINYPETAASTLEFVQRCFFKMNQYGSKVDKKRKWNMNMKVTKLIEMLSEQE